MATLDDQGYTRETADESSEKIRNRLISSFGSGIRVGTNQVSVFEEIVSVGTDTVDAAEQVGERAYLSRYVNTATGASQDEAAAFGGTTRLQKLQTTTDPTAGSRAIISGTPSTVISTPYKMKVVASGEEFDLVAGVTIGGGGTIEADFIATNFGPVVITDGDKVSTGELAFITIVAGVTDIEIDQVILGRDQETNEALRLRHNANQEALDGSIADAILDSILAVKGITSVQIFENRTNFPDSEGRPPKSFEVLAEGATDQDIRDAILASGAEGIETVGNVSGTALNKNGDSIDINFSRTSDRNIFVKITYQKNGLFPGDGETQLQNEVVTYGTDNFGKKSGAIVINDAFCVPVFNVPGITDVVILTGLTGGGEDAANIPLDFDEKAKFLVGNVTVVLA